MAKFKSTAEHPITVSSPVGVFHLDPGDTVETDDVEEVAALEANPDVKKTSREQQNAKQEHKQEKRRG